MKKRFFKTLVSSVLALSMGFGLVGCGNDSDSKSANADYAVILKTLSNDFWATMKKGIEDKAKELGVSVDIFAAQSEDDTEGQLKILENCINVGYKAIGVAPLSPTNLINGIAQANKKGVYVMNIDEKVDMDTLKSSGGSVIAFATLITSRSEKGEQIILLNSLQTAETSRLLRVRQETLQARQEKKALQTLSKRRRELTL